MKKSEIKDMLLKLREDTLKKIAGNMKMEIGHVQEAISDMYDQADDERDRQFSILLCDRDRETLGQIDDALERLEEGEYGLCEECGDKISKARLKVRPFARYCVPCKSKLEKPIGTCADRRKKVCAIAPQLEVRKKRKSDRFPSRTFATATYVK